MFWTCPQLATFWSGVFDILNKALITNIDHEPLLALFGVSLRPGLTAQDIKTIKVVAFTTILVRQAILLEWKHTSPPTHDRWISDIYCTVSDVKRCSLSGSLKLFYKTWDPFLDHIKCLPYWPVTGNM